ncbi:MAG TPA: hypothetical protein H9694_00405 [Firmicutes bacterium]|nr:hypothetical protein [Bacillota bacterium]
MSKDPNKSGTPEPPASGSREAVLQRKRRVNRIWLIVSLCVTAGLAVGMAAFLLAIRLPEPLFLEVYADLRPARSQDYGSGVVAWEYALTLPYLTNANDSSQVTSVTFPELEGDDYRVYCSTTPPAMYSLFSGAASQEVGAYSLRSVYVTILRHVPAAEAEGGDDGGAAASEARTDGADTDPAFQRARIAFSDGREMEAALGDVRLGPGGDDAGRTVMYSYSGTTSNDGTTSNLYALEYALAQTGVFTGASVTPAVPDPSLFTVTVNGTPLEALAGDSCSRILSAHAEFPSPGGIRERLTQYALSVDCWIQDESGGQSCVCLVGLLNHTPQTPSFMEALAYIRERREGAA